MNITSRFMGWFGRRTNIDQAKGEQETSPRTKTTKQKIAVNFDSAMQLSSFWAAVRIWAEVISSLPISFKKFEDGMWVDDLDSSLAFLFSGKVNRYQNKIEFFETVVLNWVVFGNAYCIIQRDASGEVIGLMPMSSSQVEVKVLDNGDLLFLHHVNNNITVYSEENIWHLKMFGNGITGLNTMGYASNSISIGLSAEERVSQTFNNAGKPPGILTFDGEVNEKQRKMLKEEFRELVEGDNLMVLEKGFEYDKTAMSPIDLQLLESRRFSIEDNGRFTGIPSVLINDTANSTVWGSGISEVIRGWYKLGLRPRVRSLELSMLIRLIKPSKRSKTKILFDFDDLLQLDRKDRSESQMKQINSGVITPNEAREEEGRKPHESGNELMINTAIQPIKTLVAQNEAETITD